MPLRAMQLGLAAGASIFVIAASNASPTTAGLQPLPWGQAHYYEGCGGCHGLNGISARREVPVLRDSVGAFLCSAEGRRYIVRLPNVAFANMDDHTLAATMNFVVFELGRGSVPAGAKPYTAEEVGGLRQIPLKNQPLAQLRAEVLAQGSAACLNPPHRGIASSVSLR